MRQSFRVLLAAMLIFSFTALEADAQEHRATIRGVVADPSAKGIANVEVRVLREETGETRRVKTDENGLFSLPELPPGVYRINVQQPGFGPFVARSELTMNQEFWLDVPLQLGTVLQAVDVMAPYDRTSLHEPARHRAR